MTVYLLILTVSHNAVILKCARDAYFNYTCATSKDFYSRILASALEKYHAFPPPHMEISRKAVAN